MKSGGGRQDRGDRAGGTRRGGSLLGRFAGIGFSLTSIVTGVAGWFVVSKLGGYANDPKNADALDPDAVPTLLVPLVDHPSLFIGLCLPTLIAGILLMANARPRGLWYGVALISLLLTIGALMACFVAFIAPLYQYQEL